MKCLAKILVCLFAACISFSVSGQSPKIIQGNVETGGGIFSKTLGIIGDRIISVEYDDGPRISKRIFQVNEISLTPSRLKLFEFPFPYDKKKKTEPVSVNVFGDHIILFYKEKNNETKGIETFMDVFDSKGVKVKSRALLFSVPIVKSGTINLAKGMLFDPLVSGEVEVVSSQFDPNLIVRSNIIVGKSTSYRIAVLDKSMEFHVLDFIPTGEDDFRYFVNDIEVYKGDIFFLWTQINKDGHRNMVDCISKDGKLMGSVSLNKDGTFISSIQFAFKEDKLYYAGYYVNPSTTWKLEEFFTGKNISSYSNGMVFGILELPSLKNVKLQYNEFSKSDLEILKKMDKNTVEKSSIKFLGAKDLRIRDGKMILLGEISYKLIEEEKSEGGNLTSDKITYNNLSTIVSLFNIENGSNWTSLIPKTQKSEKYVSSYNSILCVDKEENLLILYNTNKENHLQRKANANPEELKWCYNTWNGVLAMVKVGPNGLEKEDCLYNCEQKANSVPIADMVQIAENIWATAITRADKTIEYSFIFTK